MCSIYANNNKQLYNYKTLFEIIDANDEYINNAQHILSFMYTTPYHIIQLRVS